MRDWPYRRRVQLNVWSADVLAVLKAEYANVERLICRLLVSTVAQDGRRTAEGPRETSTQRTRLVELDLRHFVHVEEDESR